MKSPAQILENIPASTARGWNAAVVLMVVNCLLLLLQISSNANLYAPGWWPASSLQPMACANTTLAMDETLNMTGIDLSRGEVRSFRAHGIATRLIVEVGSYRNGPRTFSSVVMTSKRLNDLHAILYECEWARSVDGAVVKVTARAIKPDWNMGRLYGTMVLVCGFPTDVGTDGNGGRLELTASYPYKFRLPERFVALTEMRGEYNASRYHAPYPYEITFCGSPLYGNISPQRIREWIAYHAYFFGNRTLFIFQDAGGIHDDVYRVLQPWINLGRVHIANLRQAEVYEGYYHHQFTMLNDCLLRSQTLSNWTFFFDVDEFLYIPGQNGSHHHQHGHPNAIESLLAAKARNHVTQIRIPNIKVSDALCQKPNRGLPDHTFRDQISRKWVFEKLVYAKCQYGWVTAESRKYALQPQRAWATGVHLSEHLKDRTADAEQNMDPDTELRSYHYHNTLNAHRELCKEFPLLPNGEPNAVNVTNCTIDSSMAALAPAVQAFELAMVGVQPFIL